MRLRVAKLCRSDLLVVSGDRLHSLPLVLMHESADEVVECGAGGQLMTVFMPIGG